MRLNKKAALFCASALALFYLSLGCGEYPGMYQGETLTFETPISAKTQSINSKSKKASELDLGVDEPSDFLLTRIGSPFLPAFPYPLYDYYLEPIPVEVPVSPVFSLFDWVHPFYAYTLFKPFKHFRDDDDGLPFRHDDDY